MQRLALNVMTLEVLSPTVYTELGVPISVTGVAQVAAAIIRSLITSELDIMCPGEDRGGE